MPIVHVHMFEGRSQDQKRKLVAGMTDAMVEALGVSPADCRIILHDMSKSDYSIGGVMVADKKG